MDRAQTVDPIPKPTGTCTNDDIHICTGCYCKLIDVAFCSGQNEKYWFQSSVVERSEAVWSLGSQAKGVESLGLFMVNKVGVAIVWRSSGLSSAHSLHFLFFIVPSFGIRAYDCSKLRAPEVLGLFAALGLFGASGLVL